MASRARRLVVVSILASAVVGIWACAGDRLVLPEQEAGPGPLPGSDASCTQCSGECVDTRTDPRHCGGCATACGPGSVCNSGACATACPPTLVACNGGCVDPQSSAAHCGAKGDCAGANAGTACSGDQLCKAGVCKSNCPTSAPDTCGTTCTNLATDPTHCGSCANSCGAGHVCNDGGCGVACGPLQTTCGTGATATCHTPTAPNDCCGTLCLDNKDCSPDAGCVACTPFKSTVANNPPAPDQTTLKVTCLQTPCPVVVCGGTTFFIFSYFDNRDSFGIVGYDRNGGVVKPVVEKVGARYIDHINVDNVAKTITLVGQGGFTVQMLFSDFQ